MRYILKAESDDSRGVRRKLYCIIAGSAVLSLLIIIVTTAADVSEQARAKKVLS
jgi:hypothetical protein